MRLWIVVLMAFTTPAWAALSFTNATNVSSFTTGNAPTISGGLAGTCTGTSSTCNSCTGAVAACNEKRIFGSLVATINVTSDKTGTVKITQVDSGSFATNLAQTSGSNFATITWDTICNAVDGTTCSGITTFGKKSKALRIWLDADPQGTPDATKDEYIDITFNVINPDPAIYDEQDGSGYGIDDFQPYPGDEKTFIENISQISGWPSIGYGNAKALRFFITTRDMDSALPTLADFSVDLPLDAGTVIDNVIDDLTNGTTYTLRIGVLDEAENVVLMYPSDGAVAGCEGTIPPDPDLCPYSVVPDAVLGLLKDDLNCFIASAAYGSSLEPKLNVFRRFRNEVLLRKSWGQNFVKNYYVWGPYAAQYIHDKPALRTLTQAALWPAYLFAQLSLRWGLFMTVMLSALFMSGLGFSVWLKWRTSARD